MSWVRVARRLVVTVLTLAGSAKVLAWLGGSPEETGLVWDYVGRSGTLYIALALAELAVAGWIWTGLRPRVASGVVIVMASVFLGVLSLKAMSGSPRYCGCFGAVASRLPAMYSIGLSMVMDVMLLSSGIVLWLANRPLIRLPRARGPADGWYVQEQRSRQSRSTATAGFTLVELLITLGLVAALMALLIPATLLVRRQSQSTVCASNLRQTATALLTYVQENGRGRIPRGAIDFNTSEPLWVEAVGNVMLSGRSWQWADLQRLRALHCPSHPVSEFVSSHFLMNAFAFDSEPMWRHSPSVVWSRVKQPSEVPMLVEAADTLGSARFVLGDLYFEPALMIWLPEHLPGSTRERLGHRRHASRSNVAYFDGHVDSRRSRDWTLSLFDDGIRNRWGGSGPPR